MILRLFLLVKSSDCPESNTPKKKKTNILSPKSKLTNVNELLNKPKLARGADRISMKIPNQLVLPLSGGGCACGTTWDGGVAGGGSMKE